MPQYKLCITSFLFCLMLHINPVMALATPFLYSANSDGTVSVINTSDNSIIATMTLPVASYDPKVCLNPQLSKGFVLNSYIDTIVPANNHNSISVFNTATNTITATITDPRFTSLLALGCSPDGSKVFVSNFEEFTPTNVLVIDAKTNIVSESSIAVGIKPAEFAFDKTGSKFFVLNSGSASITVINTSNSLIENTISLVEGAYSVKVDATGTKLYVVNSLDGSVYTINVSTGLSEQILYVGAWPSLFEVNPLNGQLYIAYSIDNLIATVVPGNSNVSSSVSFVSPQAIAINDDGSKLYAVDYYTNNILSFNTQDFTTLPITVRSLLLSRHLALLRGSIHNDFSGDGKTDIIWTDTNDANNNTYMVWNMNGVTKTSETPLTSPIQPSPGVGWSLVATGDFNKDGKVDLLWRNQSTGQNKIWFMNGTEKKGEFPLATLGGTWNIVGSCDFDNDGNVDILWRNSVTGANSVWIMNGTTRTKIVSLPLLGGTWQIAGTGDFNNDGNMDILWRNPVTGANSIWVMSGNVRTKIASLAVLGGTWQVAGTGDYNNDGKIDILWRNPATGANSVWVMDGITRSKISSLPVQVGPNWQIVGR